MKQLKGIQCPNCSGHTIVWYDKKAMRFQCTTCRRIFVVHQTHRHTQLHLNTTHHIDNMKCWLCKKPAMYLHIRHTKKVVACRSCGAIQSVMVGVPLPHICPKCDSQNIYYSWYTQKNGIPRKVMVCRECGRTTYRKRVPVGSDVWCCDQQMVTKYTYDFKKHTAHVNYLCTVCGKTHTPYIKQRKYEQTQLLFMRNGRFDIPYKDTVSFGQYIRVGMKVTRRYFPILYDTDYWEDAMQDVRYCAVLGYRYQVKMSRYWRLVCTHFYGVQRAYGLAKNSGGEPGIHRREIQISPDIINRRLVC